MTGVREETPYSDDADPSDCQDERPDPRATSAWLAERFQEHRGRLRAVAYRMLGSLEEADDAVQEAWVRFSAAGADEVVNLGGWLTTIVSRVCLNTLRARAARPETLAGPRVPDPVLSPADGPTPEQEALLADSVGLALLVVLDTLTPAERVAFVLHDVFDFPFGEIAPMLGPHAGGRQAARQPGPAPGQGGGRDANRTAPSPPSRRWSAPSSPPPGPATWPRWSNCSTRTSCCAPTGSPAAPAVLRGAAAVSGAVLGGASPHAEFRPVLVNGAAGVLVTLRGRPAALMAFTVAGGRITAVDGITDPHRLRRLVGERQP